MKTEIKTITPEMAQMFLLTNNSNRNINKARVALYSKIIADGDWAVNGEAIKFDTNGTLIDGQHRLSAIIQSGISIDTLVIRGLDSSVHKTIDTGKKRSAGDCMQIENIINSTTISSGVARYLRLKQGYKSTGQGYTEVGISNKNIIDEYYQNSELYDSLFSKASSFYLDNIRSLSKSDYIGFYRHFQSKYSNEKVELFFENYTNNIGVARLLKNKFMKELILKRKSSSLERTALMLKAFNLFINGVCPKLLTYSINEKFPKLQ